MNRQILPLLLFLIVVLGASNSYSFSDRFKQMDELEENRKMVETKNPPDSRDMQIAVDQKVEKENQ